MLDLHACRTEVCANGGLSVRRSCVMRCSERFCEPTPPTRANAASALRFALVTFVCNGTLTGGPPAEAHLDRAIRLRRMLRRSGSEVRTVAVTHGFDDASMRALRRVGWHEVQDVTQRVDPGRIMRPIGSIAMGKAGKHWPRALRQTELPHPAAE